MAATQEKAVRPDAVKTAESNPRRSEIDPNAPAGSKDSLGEESIRDGRPATDDSIVEAIDEETPATPASLPR
jgi:hypothetical protein